MAFHYLAVEGPFGVGKTVLAERLASRLDATTVLEDTDNPFLADFYNDRPGAALQAQLFYLLNRHRQLTGLRQADLFLQTTVCDYLFDKDKIFAYLNLDDNELFIYQRLYELLTPDLPSPDLVIYLQTPTDVLRRIHLASAVFVRGEFSAPWAFRSTDAETLCRILQPQARTLVLFHVAVEGPFAIELDTGESALASAGDAVVLPYCDEHTMGFPRGTPAVPVTSLVPVPPWTEMPVLRHGGGGEPTQILCGYLQLPFEAAFALFIAVDAVTDTLMTLASVSTVTAATAAIAPHSREIDETDAMPAGLQPAQEAAA